MLILIIKKKKFLESIVFVLIRCIGGQYYGELSLELPSPVHVDFKEQTLRVTVWFDFVGHFTNKVYVFSNVGDIPNEHDEELDDDKLPSDWALSHLAYLRFDQVLCLLFML